MIRLALVVFVVLIILIILRQRNKDKNPNAANNYKKIIFVFLILALLFFLATSGKFLIPQLLNIIKIAIPLLTKFIGV